MASTLLLIWKMNNIVRGEGGAGGGNAVLTVFMENSKYFVSDCLREEKKKKFWRQLYNKDTFNISIILIWMLTIFLHGYKHLDVGVRGCGEGGIIP
jgi:hypothetical protein